MCRAREQQASRASHNSVRPAKLAACPTPCYPPTTIPFRKKGVIGTEPSLECVEAGTRTQWRTLDVVAAVDQHPTRD
eukprot:6106711-Prymnesium_polylepis.1